MPTSQQTVQFNEIPYAWRVPGTYVEVRPNFSNAGVFDWPARVLIIGQMLSSGTATPATAYPLTSAAQAKALFGAGSQAAQMAWAFLKANPYTRVDIMGVADASAATHANGSITPSGAATAPGTINLLIAGQPVQVGVNVGDSLTTIKANIIADINANYLSLLGEHRPARSLVEVSALPREALVEIELVARVPARR